MWTLLCCDSTDFVSFSLVFGILNISESVEVRWVEITRAAWFEHAYDCDWLRLPATASVCSGQINLVTTDYGNNWTQSLGMNMLTIRFNSTGQNWLLRIAKTGRAQFSWVEAFGVNAATTRLISSKLFCWDGSDRWCTSHLRAQVVSTEFIAETEVQAAQTCWLLVFRLHDEHW